MIMDRFHVLPNDPALKSMTPLHKMWLMANIQEEMRQRMQTIDVKDSDEEYGLPDDEYRQFKDRMKKVAGAQRKQHGGN